MNTKQKVFIGAGIAIAAAAGVGMVYLSRRRKKKLATKDAAIGHTVLEETEDGLHVSVTFRNPEEVTQAPEQEEALEYETQTVHSPEEEDLELDAWMSYTVIDEEEAGTGLYSLESYQYSYPLSRAALFRDIPIPESLYTLLIDQGINEGEHVFIREEDGVMDYEFFV
jgi:hypothetical protein